MQTLGEKPYDIASSLHVHPIKTRKQKAKFLTRILLGYADFATDLVCVVFFYNPHKTFPVAFTLSVAAIALPTVIMMLLPREDWQNRALTLFRCRLTSEAVKSWQNELETIEFCLLELIASVGGGFPSALIQLYAVMYRAVYDSDSTFDLLGPEYVLYISIGLSVLASSWTSARLFTSNEERHCSRGFYGLLIAYYGCEKLYRMFYFSSISLFMTSGGYKHGRNPYVLNAAFLLVSILARCAVVRYSHQRVVATQPTTWEDIWDFIGRILLSLATSHMWVGEYVLSCRFIMLEFLELAFYVPLFLWLQEVTDFEQNQFHARVPVSLTLIFYALKTVLLVGRLYSTAHARHVLYNHASILLREALVVLLCVMAIWAVLVTITFTT